MTKDDQKLRVLLVDDDAEIRMQMKWALAAEYEVTQAMLSVADNGCGMSAAFLKDSLFRPFHSTKQKGLGIGMFQSKMVVEAHHGNIQVESEPGKGTTFRVLLPLRKR